MLKMWFYRIFRPRKYEQLVFDKCFDAYQAQRAEWERELHG